MSVEIPLYPSTLFGYYLQLAALGVAGWDRPVGSKIVVDSPNDYVRLVENALNTIVLVRVGPGASPINLCDELRNLPTLYRAGRGDRSILREANLNDQSWCLAAVSYVEKVRNKGGPLGGQSYSPMLLRATIYGKTRTYSYIDRPRLVEFDDLSANITVDSLGLGLIGGLATFMGLMRVGNERYEYYLVPDGSLWSLKDMGEVLEVFHGAVVRSKVGSILDKINNLVNVAGLSIDNVTFFSSIIQASKAIRVVERLKGLVDYMSFERYMLVRLPIGMRPQIMWISPLTISQIVKEVSSKRAEYFLDNLYWLASRSHRVSGLVGQQAISCAAECINTVMLFFWSGQRDFLFECARKLAALSDRLGERGVPEDVVELADKTLASLKSLVA